MYRYFAYGSVLSRRHMGEWAGEHGVDARLFARGAPAVLRGYALTFDVESRFWGGRVADLREDQDGVVHGVLFELPVPAKDAVLRKEGVATGLSQELDVTIEVDGKPVQAKAFVARPEKRCAMQGCPRGEESASLIMQTEDIHRTLRASRGHRSTRDVHRASSVHQLLRTRTMTAAI